MWTGCYGEVKSTEEQLEYITKHASYFRNIKALEALMECFKASFETLTDRLTGPEDVGLLEEVIRNITSILYFMMQSSRSDRRLARTLRSMKRSVIGYLVTVTATLCDCQDGRLRGISLRQITLLLRQCILSSLGDKTQISLCKSHQRRLHQLPLEVDKSSIVTTPLDYAQFRAEITSKYPSYSPPSQKMELLADTPERMTAKTSTYLELPVYTNGQWTATPSPSPPPSPKGKKSMYTTDQTIPFVLPLGVALNNCIPSSIKEGAHLFQSRQRTTVPLAQLWQEQENFVKSERGWDPSNQEPFCQNHAAETEEDEILAEVERVYSESLPYLQSCVSGLLSTMWDVSSHNLPAAGVNQDKESEAKIEESVVSTRGWLFGDKAASDENEQTDINKSVRESEDFRSLEILLKAITGSLILLLKWFRVSHILKFEYVTQLLVDSGWIHTFHQALLALNPATNIVVDHDDSRRSYFNVCASFAEQGDHCPHSDDSDAEETSDGNFVALGSRPSQPTWDPSSNEVLPAITKFSWRTFFVTITMLNITQKVVKKKVHRNFLLVQAKTWLHLRRPMRISHDLLQLYCLKLYKGQVPLCSRKWRMSNMKVITQIYMLCRPELREDWIAGTEIDTDLKEAKQHENAIRALILHYNMRRYPDQMESLGFHQDEESDDDDDFFETELGRGQISL